MCSAGTDPATDLRGTGFLGLMHALYFVMDPEILPLARDIYKLSQHPTQVSSHTLHQNEPFNSCHSQKVTCKNFIFVITTNEIDFIILSKQNPAFYSRGAKKTKKKMPLWDQHCLL